MKRGDNCNDILLELLDQAVTQFGEARADELAEFLEQTAHQIWQMDQTTPSVDLEPGFYQ